MLSWLRPSLFPRPRYEIAPGRAREALPTPDVPARVEVRDLTEHTVVKLATERKHLTDLIKMLAYQAESDLCSGALLLVAGAALLSLGCFWLAKGLGRRALVGRPRVAASE